MKNLELNEMEEVSGGAWFTGFSCVLTVAASAAVLGAGTVVTAGTAGPAAVMALAYVAGAACGASLGYRGHSGSWI